ncbi:MAG: hypothetical protein AAB824_00640 [Patescibacteria group bacterium]
MDKRLKKQIIVGAVVGVVFVLIIILLIIAIKPSATCFDGKQNQNETGIDCGGSCAKQCVVAYDPEIKFAKFFKVGQNSVDMVAEVSNKNYSLASDYIPYTFTLYDQAGQTLATKSGNFYILPGKSRFVIEQNIFVSRDPAKVDFKLGSIKWNDMATLVPNQNMQDINNIQLLNQDPALQKDPLGNPQLFSNMVNQSFYDFDLIEIDLVAYDANNNIIADGQTFIRTVKANEKRVFSITWPKNSLSASPVKFDVRATTNIFNPDNFLNQSGGSRPF